MKYLLVPFLFLGTLLHAGIVTTEVTYTFEGTDMKGYIAYDDAVAGKRPGVLVVHEWWGHNAYARSRAEQLAGMGYIAMAIDMYGEGKQADHPDDAGKFAGMVMSNLDTARKRFDAALLTLQSQEQTDGTRVAAIGYCFGGGVVLHMARMGVPLKGVASFHGSLGTEIPAKPGAVKPAVLVCHGAEDPFIPAEAVKGFKEEMEAAGVALEFHAYDGASHSFTNPDADTFGKKFSLPLAYDEKADKQSWADLTRFLKRVFAAE